MSKDAGMTLLRALAARPVAYNPDVARAVGSVKAAIFLCQLLYWTGKGKRIDGFIWKTRAEMEKETALSRAEQDGARRILRDLGIIEEKLAGVPAKTHYRVSLTRFTEVLDQYYSLQDTGEPDCGKVANLLAESPQAITENTQENTQENTIPPTAVEEVHSVGEQASGPCRKPGTESRVPDHGRRGHMVSCEMCQHSQQDPGKTAGDQAGGPEGTGETSSYVPLGEDGWPEEVEHPIIAFVEAESRALGVKRRLSKAQRGRLMRPVQQSGRYPSPASIFSKDPDFRGYLRDAIHWANGGDETARKPTLSMISAIRNYEREGTGWLEHKHQLEEKRAGRSARTSDGAHQAQTQRDGASGDADEPTGNPTIEEYIAAVFGTEYGDEAE